VNVGILWILRDDHGDERALCWVTGEMVLLGMKIWSDSFGALATGWLAGVTARAPRTDRCPPSRRSRGLRKSRKRFRNRLESLSCLRRKAGKQAESRGERLLRTVADCAARNIGTCFPPGQSLWSPGMDPQYTDHHRVGRVQPPILLLCSKGTVRKSHRSPRFSVRRLLTFQSSCANGAK